jgi:hypothetical protein
MESAERDRMTVKRTILTIQGFAQNLQLWAGLKKSISALTDIASVFICNEKAKFFQNQKYRKIVFEESWCMVWGAN